MDAKLNRTSFVFGVPGIAMQLVGIVMQRTNDGPRDPRVRQNDSMADAGLGLQLIGTVLLIVGLSFYARAKGHSGWWGLMGLLSIIGLIVLACLPDKLKAQKVGRR